MEDELITMRRKTSVFLHVQHHKPRDMGARATGLPCEVELATTYATYAKEKLENLYQIQTILEESSEKRYKEVWAECDSAGHSIYIACHINSGIGGKKGHGIVFFDERSPQENGYLLSSMVAKNMPGSAVKTISTGKGDKNYPRVYGCFMGVQAVALLIEPFFIDDIENRRLASDENLKAIGYGIATGCHEWIENKAQRTTVRPYWR